MYGGISRKRWKIKLIGVQQRARDMESAVLIDIREFFQMPQRTFAALPCATFGYWKGLLSSNQRDGVATNAIEKLCSPASAKPGLGFEDGELVFTAPWGRFTIAQDVKLPDDMVQGRSKIVDDLANTNAPDRIGGSLNVNANGERLRLSVEIDPWNVRCWIGIEKSSQIGLQSIDLIPCSPSLQSDAGELIVASLHTPNRVTTMKKLTARHTVGGVAQPVVGRQSARDKHILARTPGDRRHSAEAA